MTDELPPIRRRKDEHLALAARPEALHAMGTGIGAYRLRHRALPERDLDTIDLTTRFVGASLAAPFIVSAMTGGTERAREVNARLAEAASEHGLAMGLGSGRVLLADPSLRPTFVSGPRPPVLLANLGAVQLRKGLTPDDAARLIELLDADGIVLHLNPIQEAIQPGGDTTFAGIAERIALVCQRLKPKAVIVKEVGFGLAPEDIDALISCGVSAIDVAGAGGTSWAKVEGMRDARADEVAAAFGNWGWPTTETLVAAVNLARPAGVPVIASGGIRDGVEAAIALALGATLVGLARPLLLAALENRARESAAVLVDQLRIAVWAAGAGRPDDLGPANLRKWSE